MDKTTVQKAVDLTVSAWPIEHPSDLAKVVGVFEILIKEGHRAKDDEIFQYVVYGMQDRSTSEAELMRPLASELQRIYEVVETVLDPNAPRFKEEWVRKELFG